MLESRKELDALRLKLLKEKQEVEACAQIAHIKGFTYVRDVLIQEKVALAGAIRDVETKLFTHTLAP